MGSAVRSKASAGSSGRGRTRDPAPMGDRHVASEFQFAREVALATKCPAGFSVAQKERLGTIASALATGRRLEAERLWRSFAMSSFASAKDGRLDPTIAYVLHTCLDLAPPAEVDPELDSMRLQNVLQTRQNTLQTLSNMSKSMHETARSVIQNLR